MHFTHIAASFFTPYFRIFLRNPLLHFLQVLYLVLERCEPLPVLAYPPQLNLFRIFWNCVFAKYTVQTLLLYSLTLELPTGKR